MRKVCNALNTTDYDQIDGLDCIDYWSEKRNEPARFCRVSHKEGTPGNKLVGGHVITIDKGTPHVYIVPMLSSYNAMKENLPAFFVDDESLVEVPRDQEQKILSDPDNIKEIERQKNEPFFNTLKKFR